MVLHKQYTLKNPNNSEEMKKKTVYSTINEFENGGQKIC